ncbi:MAG TPA: cellulase family glycosylhydrolase [Polyangiaceae bacterium]|nr:cellulase family glycosylhydrolase [Polyangiaceae bacterium]
MLVDDFEDGNNVSLLGGYWYGYDDKENGGLSSLDLPKSGAGPRMVGEGFESKLSLQAQYHLDRGKLPYPPYVGIGVTLPSKYADLREYGALQYTYKGGKHEVRIETANVEKYDFHAIQLPESASWRTVTLDFALFRQGGWGPKVPFALEQSKALGWQVRGDTGYAGQLQIDQVRLLPKSALTAQSPDLEVRPAAPPAQSSLPAGAITHPLQAVAKKALDDGYNITNWLEEKRFAGYGLYDETFVKKLARAGFKGLRLPIDLDLYAVKSERVGTRMVVEVHPDLFKILDDFDKWTKAQGLSFTIDYHQYDHSLDIESADSTAQAVALWEQVAAHFAKNPRQDLFYELLNEPELSAKRGPSAAEWTKLASEMIAAIRQHDKKRPVLFGDVRWYGIDELVSRTPFTDPNIIYVFHFYEPFIFTHQGAPWAGLGTTHDVPYPYSPERWSKYQRDLGFSEFNEGWQIELLHNYYQTGNREALRNRLITVKGWAVQHNVPIICNEFGAYEAAARREDIVRYYTDLISLFGELEIPWQVWFMIMDANTGQVAPDYHKAFSLEPRP